MLDYIKTIVSEGLIDPQWYDQTWDQKTKTKQGKIGIEWYPGAITEETEMYQKDKLAEGESTINWWKTYNLPTDGGKYSGYMPIDSYFGKIIFDKKIYQSITNEQLILLAKAFKLDYRKGIID